MYMSCELDIKHPNSKLGNKRLILVIWGKTHVMLV